MGEIRHIAFRAGAKRQPEAEKNENVRETAQARDHRQNNCH
jgi:hypothetical protein